MQLISVKKPHLFFFLLIQARSEVDSVAQMVPMWDTGCLTSPIFFSSPQFFQVVSVEGPLCENRFIHKSRPTSGTRPIGRQFSFVNSKVTESFYASFFFFFRFLFNRSFELVEGWCFFFPSDDKYKHFFKIIHPNFIFNTILPLLLMCNLERLKK